jgi:hypothetical protein
MRKSEVRATVTQLLSSALREEFSAWLCDFMLRLLFFVCCVCVWNQAGEKMRSQMENMWDASRERPSLVLFLSLYYINFIVIKEERSGAHT